MIGHDATFQAAPPVGQHDVWHPAELGGGLAQLGQRGGLLLIGGEAHKPPPRPRDTAHTTCTPHWEPQPIARCSPGDHTAGRRLRWCSTLRSFFTCATRRRKFRSEPTYPAARAAASKRLAEIRPATSSPLGHQVDADLVVVGSQLEIWANATGLSPLDHPHNRLVLRAADGGHATIRTGPPRWSRTKSVPPGGNTASARTGWAPSWVSRPALWAGTCAATTCLTCASATH